MKRAEIIKILHNIEQNEDIRIIYACEAKDRVWGFESEESDFNVRFIYKKHNLRDYLSLKNASGVVECEGDGIDIVGFDIRNALKMHHANDLNLREWLVSGDVYIDRGIKSVFSGLGGFDKVSLKNQYADFAQNHWRKYCTLEFKKAKTKKYLYVIRAILSWMLLNRDICPPININELLDHERLGLDESIGDAIRDLIDYHLDRADLSEDTVLKLNNFILDSLSRMKNVERRNSNEIGVYDERFRELLLVCR